MNKDRQRPAEIKPPRNRKLSTQDKTDIQERRANGERAIDLAAEYGVSTRTIRNQ
jgi:hypothetical protein